jgi:hypothetical protein
MHSIRPIRATAVAALFAAATLTAQDRCPNTMAVRVPASVQYGASVACSGVTYSSGGVTLTTATGCPLFATIAPEHHDIAPTTKRTKAVEIGARPGIVAFFVCRTSYLIFIPIGSTCAFDRELVAGAYPILATMPCEDA